MHSGLVVCFFVCFFPVFLVGWAVCYNCDRCTIFVIISRFTVNLSFEDSPTPISEVNFKEELNQQNLYRSRTRIKCAITTQARYRLIMAQ